MQTIRNLTDFLSLGPIKQVHRHEVKTLDNLILSRYFGGAFNGWSEWRVEGTFVSAAEFAALQEDLKRLADAAGWETGEVTTSAADTITIPKAEYIQLRNDQLRLNALQAGGVDNWDGYGDAIASYGQVDPDTLAVVYPKEDAENEEDTDAEN